ncbi:MAG: MarR family transcriptional regulator [Eubacteriales bacterium]|nr:MarR family transcriptional regulator [Eubacteriales bacterium]
MNYNELIENEDVSFGNMPAEPFLTGLLSAFENRFQACADSFFKEVTWKQFFTIICVNLCKEAPTLNELAGIMGSSHQNVKQILLKLEKVGFVEFVSDEKDKRKQRVQTTKKCMEFCKMNEEESQNRLARLYEGVTQEQLMTTIYVISRMEKNLKNM